MARSISEEEIQLKKRARRRLVGAVVLVTVVAVVLPMVLDSEPRKPNGSVEIQIPSPDAGPYNPKITPPVAAPASKPATEALPPKSTAAAPNADVTTSSAAPAAAASEKPEQPAATAEPPAKSVSKAPEPAKRHEEHSAAASKEAPKAVPNGKFVVQIAALTDAAKAKQLQQEVAHGGLKSYTEVVKTAKGRVTRVRAGPYATREAAEKARAQLKAAGLDGKVVPK